MFKFFDVDRRIRTLIMIALVASLIAAAVPAEEAETLGRDLSIVFGGDFFQDPDEDAPDPDPFQDPDEAEPDPDPFQDPDEAEPDPDPFQDPDEAEPDPDPLVAEVYPLVLTGPTAVLFQVDGAALVALYNAAGHRLFVSGDGEEVVMTLAAGRYDLRVEEWSEARGAVRLYLQRVPNP